MHKFNNVVNTAVTVEHAGIGAVSPGIGMALLNIANATAKAIEQETDFQALDVLREYETVIRWVTEVAVVQQGMVIAKLEALINAERETGTP